MHNLVSRIHDVFLYLRRIYLLIWYILKRYPTHIKLNTFGKEIVYGGGAVSLIANIIWIIVSGIPLAISALTNGLLLCLTIIGIPFGKQCFKFARLALSPFGAAVV